MAVWFTALLLVSIVPAVAPTASATHINTTASSAVFVVKQGSNYVNYDGRLIGPGAEVGVDVQASIVTPCPTGFETSGRATLDIDNELVTTTTGNPIAALELDTGTIYRGSIRFTVVGNFSGANGVEGTAESFTVTIDRMCALAGQPPQVLNEGTEGGATLETTQIKADTRKPRMRAVQTIWSNATSHANVSTAVAGIGATIQVAGPLYDELNPSKLTANFTEFGFGTNLDINIPSVPASGQPVTPGTILFQINETTPIDGQMVMRINLTDAAGNSAATNNSDYPPGAAFTRIAVDNVRPNAAAVAGLFLASNAVLNRSMEDPRVTVDPRERALLQLNWTIPAGAHDVDHAAVLIHQEGTTPVEAPVGAVPFADDDDTEGIKRYDTGCSNPAPLPPCGLIFTVPDSKLTKPLFVHISPADDAGNVAYGLKVPVAFPQISMSYSGSTGSGFVGGSLIGDLTVSVTGDIATKPAGSDIWPNLAADGTACPTTQGGVLVCPSPNALLYGMLVRYSSTHGDSYWYNNVSANLAAGTVGNIVGHFSDTALLDPDAVAGTADIGETFFRAAGAGYSSNTNIVLSNLSNVGHTRNYLDGLYHISLNSTSSNGKNFVAYNYTLRVDGDKPDIGSTRNYTGTQWPAGGFGSVNSNTALVPTNMTDLHGMDGNPFRVVLNATDFHTERGTESGIRNVTVELVDTTKPGWPLVKHTIDGSAARIDINSDGCGPTKTLVYCVPMTEFPPVWDSSVYTDTASNTNLCDPDNTPAGSLRALQCQTYRDITPWVTGGPPPYANLSKTFFNLTQFSGWFNTTMADLPPGNFSVRLLAYDKAGQEVATPRIVQDGASQPYYQVAPAVRILPTGNTPAITSEGQLDVVVGAMQRYNDVETLDDAFEAKCKRDVGRNSGATDICPAQKVIIYVSNTNGAADVGAKYQERTGVFVTSSTEDVSVKGFDGGIDAANGKLSFTDPNAPAGGSGVPLRFYRYTSTSPPPLSGISGIQTGLPIYVRAEVVSYKTPNDALSQVLISRSTEWVQVASAALPKLNITQPAFEWSINTSDQLIPFNVSFNRTGEPGVPNLQYQIWKLDNETKLARVDYLVANDNTADFDPRNPSPSHVFNWTGNLTQNATVAGKLDAGVYQLRVCAYLGTTQCWDAATGLPVAGIVPLALTWRNFTVLSAKPTINIPGATAESQPDKDHMIWKEADKFVVPDQFDVRFEVNLKEGANITAPAGGLLPWRFTLERRDPPIGAPSTYTSNGDGGGTGGFTVTVLTPLPDFSKTGLATFTARVDLPDGLGDRNELVLFTRVNYGVNPLSLDNTSDSVDLLFDKFPPTPVLQVPNTLGTIFETGSVPPRNRALSDATPFSASLVGTITETTSEPKFVQVRLVDLNASKTIEFLLAYSQEGRGGALQDGLHADFWARNTPVQGKTFVDVTRDSPTSSTWTWRLPLYRPASSSIPSLIVFDADGRIDEQKSVINLSHTYRVDIRVTDSLGHESNVVEKSLAFDAAPPYLGYKDQLGVSSSIPSGIFAPKTRFNWHGENDALLLTANVSDNDCVAAVRLVGFSSMNPSNIVKANMSLIAKYYLSNNTRFDLSPAERARPCYPGLKLEYALDLSSAPHMTDDVANYTYWFEAEDYAGQLSAVEPAYRQLKIEVLDNTPARVQQVQFDPFIGQAGGRTLIRAFVRENVNVSHVTVQVRNLTTLAILAQANMTPVNGTGPGVTVWQADTTADLNFTLETGVYLVNVTAYDVNWNRSTSPTCANRICPPNLPQYIVRDDGAPAVALESPIEGATIGANSTIKFRALHKNLETSMISVRASTDGNASNIAPVPASTLNFTELKSATGARQGWTVTYTPAGLADNQTLVVNITATVASIFDGKTFSFRVDAAPPTVEGNLTGATASIANKTWATRATRAELTANDTVSPTTILYSVNGGPQQTYSGPLTPSGEGEWRLEFWASDAAGNLAAKKTLSINVDPTGPRATVAKHGDDLLLTVTDGTGVGLNESSVTVHYRYGTTTTYSTKRLDKLTGNSFGTTLPGNATETGLAYYFTAQDLLGNEGGVSNLTAAAPYRIIPENDTAANLPPTIRITAPSAGTVVRNSVEIKWLAEDPEEAPLTISIAIRDPSPGRVLVAAGENSGAYTINTTGFPAGAYTVVVTAVDGVNDATAQVTFNVEVGDAIQIRNVPPPTVQPNTQVGVAIAITTVGKTVAQAQYRLIKDGQLLTSGILGQTQQGLFAAGFAPSQPGNYSVVVDVAYTDGSTEPTKQVATFSVPGTTTPPDEGGVGLMPTSLMALLAVAVLTVALAAYGAFGRWKK